MPMIPTSQPQQKRGPHRFQKGNKAALGNPGPTRLKPLTQALIAKIHEIDENTSKEKIWTLVDALYKCAVGFTLVRYEGKGKDRVKIEEEVPPDLPALKYLWDRIEGVPKMSTDDAAVVGGRVTIVFEPADGNV